MGIMRRVNIVTRTCDYHHEDVQQSGECLPAEADGNPDIVFCRCSDGTQTSKVNNNGAQDCPPSVDNDKLDMTSAP